MNKISGRGPAETSDQASCIIGAGEVSFSQ